MVNPKKGTYVLILIGVVDLMSSHGRDRIGCHNFEDGRTKEYMIGMLCEKDY
jgi:hypothetical protein